MVKYLQSLTIRDALYYASGSPVVAVAGVITHPPVDPHAPHKGLCPGAKAETPSSDR
jgi:hypothetical protein